MKSTDQTNVGTTNDRLADLSEVPAWSQGVDDYDVENGDSQAQDDFESIPQKEEDAGKGANMDQFFKDLDALKEDIEAIKEATKRIEEINEEALMATSDRDEADLSNELRPLIDQTNKRAKNTKATLGLLKDETEKLKKKSTKASDIR